MPTPASSSSRSGAVPRKLSASPGGRAVARAALASLPTPQLTTQLQAGLSDVTRRIAVDAPRHVGTVRALGDAVTEVVARWRRSTALSLSGIGALENDVARMLVLIRQQNSRLKAQKTQIEALQREKEAMRSYAANLERLVPDKDKPAPVPASGPGNAEARATNERKIAELSQAVKQGDREALNRFFDALETESMNEGSDQSSSPPGSTSAAKAAAAPAKPTQPKTTPKASGKSKQTKPSAAPPPPPPAPPALPAPPTPSSRKTGSHASPPQPASTPPPPRVAASSASPAARAGSSSSSGSGSGSAVAAPVHSSPALPPPASPAVPVADVPVVDAATPKPPTDEDTATLQRAMAFAAQGAPTPTAPPPARKPPARPAPSPAVAKAVAAASNGAAPPTAPAPAPAPTRPPPPPVAPARPPGPPPTSAAPASSGTSGGGGGGGDVMGPDTVLIELRLDEEQHKRATVGDLKDAVRGQVGRPFTAVLANGRLLLKDSAMLAEAGIGTSVTLEVRFRSQHTSTSSSSKAAPPRASSPPGAFRG